MMGISKRQITQQNNERVLCLPFYNVFSDYRCNDASAVYTSEVSGNQVYTLHEGNTEAVKYFGIDPTNSQIANSQLKMTLSRQPDHAKAVMQMDKTIFCVQNCFRVLVQEKTGCVKRSTSGNELEINT